MERPAICGCGYADCWYAAMDYWYCSGIGCHEHHRLPVAAEPDELCPVDVWTLGFLLDEATAEDPV